MTQCVNVKSGPPFCLCNRGFLGREKPYNEVAQDMGARTINTSIQQPLTLDEMRLGEGGGSGSLSLASFEPELIRPVPPMLAIADSEVRWVVEEQQSCACLVFFFSFLLFCRCS